ncbi:MAG: hypothetical protein H6772_00720 [Pseudomonadales bacterium]|nr:hypothetical protein [Pseudomonadales bacterium]
MEEPEYPDEFAHVLEHAILSVVDNNLSTPATFSTGYTTISGRVSREDPIYHSTQADGRISYGRKVVLNLSPLIPPSLREKYVLFIIGEIVRQYKSSNTIDLNLIKLET